MSVLDTTFFIDLFRRDTGATQLWNAIFRGETDAAFSPVTAFELWLGRLSPGELNFYDDILVLVRELPLTTPAAQRAAAWLRDMPRPAAERLIRDALVAATAAGEGVPVSTRNIRDFSNFEGVEVRRY